MRLIIIVNIIFIGLLFFLAGFSVLILIIPIGIVTAIGWVVGSKLVESSFPVFFRGLSWVERVQEKDRYLILKESIEDRELKEGWKIRQRAYLPITLMAGMLAFSIQFLSGIIDFSNISIQALIIIFFPMIPAIITPFILVATDSRARIFKSDSNEITKFGINTLRVVESITGFTAIIRLFSLGGVVGSSISFLGGAVILFTPLILTFTMEWYLKKRHWILVNRKFENVQDAKINM